MCVCGWVPGANTGGGSLSKGMEQSVLVAAVGSRVTGPCQWSLHDEWALGTRVGPPGSHPRPCRHFCFWSLSFPICEQGWQQRVPRWVTVMSRCCISVLTEDPAHGQHQVLPLPLEPRPQNPPHLLTLPLLPYRSPAAVDAASPGHFPQVDTRHGDTALWPRGGHCDKGVSGRSR